MSYGSDVPIESMTSRDHGWPCLRQFCVFMENRVGRLHELFQILERNDLRIIAMSVVDTADFSTVRLMVDDADRARELFTLSKFTWFENNVLGVCLPDDDQPMVKVCLALVQAELNIHYTYSLLYRRGGRGAIAIGVDDVETAQEILKERGLEIITEDHLRDDDNYFT
ncbi:MAG: acetolactate synthase [Rubinisphaera brasiliensis]|uniref:Amino acid-binding ACT domain-containing protein n=1 Tax=Rubinisphaera brasiliensis (strain ATCC 49424 / DSM 5305 / JCM 21570 / IAM 15109 / NBRC 103401 / IFAM 1448) TaxID=756272 RepID=F0SKY6_RUBBR|nr:MULTISPECIES: amino acid-binding protein [Rubinisphaera]ADY59839.1 amino acid-binding ACT domain-containing protein [Rubinisphaera brasiliensis DSM 5305]MBB03860.1 acetolactate synthase [Planctomyces sp.]MBR9803122.1 acetolactate synthase [bacterium]